ncbi:DNA-dependent ATPase mgs1 [Coemansia sp. RSA 1365]|nr:DNA-dependent ATPase mgs1 [Coemansia sp. RSA 1365]
MSSLVNCPICSKSVPEWYVSDHLDRECRGLNAEGTVHSAENSRNSASVKRDTDPPSTAGQRKRTAFTLFSSDETHQSKPSVDGEKPAVVTTGVPQPTEPTGTDIIETEKRLRNMRLPLAERLRPLTLDRFYGQHELVGPDGILRALIESDQISSMIFWGGPGLGKTTLARIIARRSNASFKEMSAVTQNISDVKRVIEEAGNLGRLAGKQTILFLDEIHRFNKAQQDVFLPYLERGQIVLIGATTENPSFRLNGALLSRCRVFQLESLSHSDIVAIANRAYNLKQEDSGQNGPQLGPGIAEYIASVSNGDARTAINVVDLAVNSLTSGVTLSLDCVRRALQRTHVVYGAEEHYDIISALHKSVRGGDANAALYWLGRMLQGGDDPVYIARRMVRMASEDIGLADNSALPLAMATLHACQAIGMPECDVILAHCATYLARAPKSVEAYKAINKVKNVLAEEHPWPVPLHLRNAPTNLMKELGYAKDYKYNPDYKDPVEQDYLPEQIKHYHFFS